ncbi:hypothetical protein [Cupriavidus sp. D39]|uniref:hypothetical protein n=1 Tax=Cupriavidus sp. D39 TaxID=2997877 RepID=UPI00226F4AB2|nr:hypothetical protein [Cupriavidus sp. D39]MCY0858781.1 hypothetical protein [Cupriavidus sp. D39]
MVVDSREHVGQIFVRVDIVGGYGYEITGLDVLDAGRATMQAATHAGIDPAWIREQIRLLTAKISPQADFVSKVLQAI